MDLSAVSSYLIHFVWEQLIQSSALNPLNLFTWKIHSDLCSGYCYSAHFWQQFLIQSSDLNPLNMFTKKNHSDSRIFTDLSVSIFFTLHQNVHIYRSRVFKHHTVGVYLTNNDKVHLSVFPPPSCQPLSLTSSSCRKIQWIHWVSIASSCHFNCLWSSVSFTHS